ncbi:hypothetical protein RAAC3_TM7C00001G0324 [Candidatus Saccharibacteria bacterium RAAC3_TM7_1]|nr:hypothetical protein RAAC3_TM7C00001G0324 [Candidatus Saccharibacteria bacterium RAAC3_TM7_1]
MWELVLSFPRGRMSTRNFIMLFATFLVVVFTYLLLSPTSVYAASDATWQDDKTILYDGRTYQGPIVKQASDTLPGVPDGSIVFVDLIKDQKKGSVIFFDSTESKSYLNESKSATFISYEKYTGGENGLPEFSDPGTSETIHITPRAPPIQEPTSSCDLDGIGWIICPVSKAIAESMDFLYGVITKFFEVSLLTTNDSSLYRMWDIARSIANVLFVVGFLIMIYGQITGGLLSNYTIKKLLPRLIIAAILVNLSYWICALGVDLSNILGFSIQNMFESLRAIAGAPNSAAANTATPTWANVSAGVLAGGGAVLFGASAVIIASGTGVGLAMLLLSALIPAIFAAIVAVAVLAARQALITIFIIISPLAFVAYLLPNTEEWFTRWRKLFMNMLIMFPAFSVIFGGAQLAGTLIIQNTDSIIVVILGMTVQIVPLFITPFLIKLSGGLLSAIANITNDKSKGVFDRTKNWADTRRGQEQARGRMQQDQRAKRLGFQDGRRQYNSRLRRGLARTNPNNLAYYRDYRRREREAMKTANESMSEGLFTQTAAGRRIYTRSHDAEAEKHYGESTNFEGYKTAMATGNDRQNVYRRQLHHEAHLAKGRGDIYEESLTAHAERDLQTQINQTQALRDRKIHATVDTKHAEAIKARLDTEAELEFKSEFTGSSAAARGLRRLYNETQAMKKEAGTIDTILEKRADAYFDRTSRTDDHVRNLRLQAVEATDSATKYEEQWNKLIANIRADGASAPNITLNADKMAAGRIKQLGQDIEVEKWGQEAAKRVQQANMSNELKTNDALRTYAGGIGGESASNRIYAKAKKDIVSAYLEDVENSRSVLSEYSLAELIKLHQTGHDRDENDVSSNEALRDAAMREILLTKGNNWAYQRTKDYVSTLGMNYDEDDNAYYELVRDAQGFIQKDAEGKPLKGVRITDQAEIDRRRDIQQLFVESAKNSKLAIKSFSGTDRGNAEVGTFFLEGQEAIVRDINDKKINASRLAQTDVDELQRTIQILRDDDMRGRIDESARVSLVNTIEFALTDPQVRAGIGDREAELMQVIGNYISDRRSTIPMETKVAYETYAKTKAPTVFRTDRVHDFDDGRGPNGQL